MSISDEVKPWTCDGSDLNKEIRKAFEFEIYYYE